VVNANISVWEQDPGNGANPDGGSLIHRQSAVLDAAPFATKLKIAGAAPPADNYHPGMPAFRYWACSDALRRASDFWGQILGKQPWNPAVGSDVLPVLLDEGSDLNAYYDRSALNFFHAAVGGRMVYSGESPDIVCHEHGHAILDSLRRELWDVAAFEVPAFHESFGDMSAILIALQLPSVRTGVLQETNNKIYQSSRLSRLAKQLGWAIRQIRPDAVDSDCLRNAVNSFYYRDPNGLPTSSTSGELSSEAHSFSRVFTGAFFEALALMFTTAGAPTEQTLHQVSVDIAKILVQAIAEAPIVPEYFAQVGAHLVTIAMSISSSYGDAMKTAMVRHGIISVPGVAAIFKTSMAVVPPGPVTERELDVSNYGLIVPTIHVVTAGDQKRYAIAGAAPSVGDTATTTGDRAALGFFEDLIRRGRLDDNGYAHPQLGVIAPFPRVKTHRLVKEGDRVVLRRIRIDCGLHGHNVSKKP
jgi:hypothetical protein